MLNQIPDAVQPALPRPWPVGGGEMGALIRAHDWAATPLGGPPGWPAALKTLVDLMLGQEAPMAILWGPTLVPLYNDGYRRLIGALHPQAFGRPLRQTGGDAWELHAPLYARVLKGETVTLDEPLFPPPTPDNRFGKAGRLRLCHGPARDEDGTICGIFVTAVELPGLSRGAPRPAESEGYYRTLFNSIDAGFCTVKVVFDADERPVDYVFLEVNPAFEALTGLRDAVGQSMRSMRPHVDEHWFEMYGRVAKSGQAERVENYANAVGRWFDMFAFRIGKPGDHEVALLFRDVTERRKTEESLAFELAAMTRLHRLSRRVSRAVDLPTLLKRILDATIELHGADFGCFQLFDSEEKVLRIATHRGFKEPFLSHFAAVSIGEPSASGMALARRHRVVIEDIERDTAYAPHHEAARQAGFRAIQATPLFSSSGAPLGVLSTHFRQPHRIPRRVLKLTDIYALQAGDAIAAKLIERSLKESEQRFREFAENSVDTLWIVDAEAQRVEYLSPAFETVWGEPPDAVITDLGHWNDLVHPDDRQQAAEGMGRLLAGEVLTHEYRIVRAADGAVRWIRDTGFPIRDDTGGVRRIAGIAQDITEKKEAEERQSFLIREVDHRAKNALAVVQAVVRLTKAHSMEAFVHAVQGRIAALARAHSLLAKNRWVGVDLYGLIAEELTPYAGDRPNGLRMSGPALTVAAEAVQALGMVFHELATNAAKYGALSTHDGSIEVSWRRGAGDEICFAWRERGGPPVSEPTHQGFGSAMIAGTVVSQLGGAVKVNWLREGLCCEFSVAADRVSRDERRTPAPPPPIEHAEATVSLDGRRVLIVEDDALIAVGLKADLSAMGCRPIGPASTLEEALRMAATESGLDAAVLDVNLQGREAWPVAAVLRARDVPYVIASGYGALPQAGDAPVLEKPVPVAKLRAVLQLLVRP